MKLEDMSALEADAVIGVLVRFPSITQNKLEQR